MKEIEFLRQKLHKIIETEDTLKILQISQELDQLILFHLKKQPVADIKTA